MADQNVNATGCLGRALTLLGVVWIGVIILGSIGLLSELGMGADFLAGVGGSIIPGLLLLAAGRALRRRAASMGEQMEVPPAPVDTSTSERRVPSIRLEPTVLPGSTPPPVKDLPRPTVKPPPRATEPIVEARREVVRSLDDLVSKTEEKPAADMSSSERKPTPRKTSQELVDEARRRWGMGKRP